MADITEKSSNRRRRVTDDHDSIMESSARALKEDYLTKYKKIPGTDYLFAELEKKIKNIAILERDKQDRAVELIAANVEIIIQDKEKRERALEMAIANAFLKNLIDFASSPIIVWDNQFHITRFNHAFEMISGRSEEEILGQSLEILFPPEFVASSMELVAKASATDRWNAVEIKIIHRDQSLRTLLWNSATLLDPELKTPIATIAQGQDITRRILAEEEKSKIQAQLIHSQTLDSLGLLAGGVAHDMNNVLGAILGMASASIETQSAGSAVALAFGIIIKAAERGGKMIKSLLNFARQGPIEECELDMNTILLEEVRILERTTFAKISLEMDLASNLRPIRGDASTLSNAFMNLCVNSVDAMSEQGTLTLRTRNVDNNWIEAMVEDTGTGMSPDVLKKAMDPFFTTKPLGKGTGLGLSMVYSAVKAHHGQVDIQSEPGRGTRIRLRFPACAPAFRTMAPVPKPPPATSCPAMHTLVVDDDELIQFTLRSMLEILGHKATLAPSGEEALALVEAGLQPDVIILDMNMPGLGGAGTLPRLRALLPNVPILLATGRPDAAVFDLLLAHPYVSLLAKPFTVKVLQSLLLHTQPVIPTNVTPELK